MMKNAFRKMALLFVAMLVTSHALQAAGPGPTPPPVPFSNIARVYNGSMILAQVGDFFGTLYGQGIVTTFPSSTNLPDGRIAGPVAGGVLDLNTGQGEVQSFGGITFTSGSLIISLQRITVDVSPAGGFITAAVIVDGVYQGRQPVFQLVSVAPASGPLSLGEYVTPAQNFVVNPAFASQIGDYFHIAAFPTDTPVGSVALDVQLVTSGL